MTHTKHLALAMMTLFLLTIPALAGNTPGKKGAITVEARQRSDHSDFAAFPYVEGDMTWLFAYEYKEGDVFWQLGLDYSGDPGSTSLVEEVTCVMTPQVSIYWIKDYFWGGVGIAKSYVKAPESFWTGFYWQLGAGLAYPMSNRFEVQAGAYYVFDDWGDLGHFATTELEYGLGLTYFF